MIPRILDLIEKKSKTTYDVEKAMNSFSKYFNEHKETITADETMAQALHVIVSGVGEKHILNNPNVSAEQSKEIFDRVLKKIKIDTANAEDTKENIYEFLSLWNWWHYKQIYTFDKTALEMLFNDCDCQKIPAYKFNELPLPYNAFVINNDIKYFDETLDTLVITVDNERNKFNKITGEEKEELPIFTALGYIKGREDNAFTMLYLTAKKDETIKEAVERQFGKDLIPSVYGILNLVLYLASDKKEIVKEPNAGSKIKKHKQAYRIKPNENKVAYKLGSTIREYKVRYENTNRNREKSQEKRSVRPHTRSAHFQHYWVGTGRTQMIVKFKAPYFVNGGSDVATVHKVKKG